MPRIALAIVVFLIYLIVGAVGGVLISPWPEAEKIYLMTLTGVWGAVLVMILNLKPAFKITDFGWYDTGGESYRNRDFALFETAVGHWNLFLCEGDKRTHLWHFREPMSKDLLEKIEVLIQQFAIYQLLNSK